MKNERVKSITSQDNRFYLVDGEYYPSVTTILTAYPKSVGFFKWLTTNGNWQEAEKAKEEAGSRGSKVHNAILQLINGKRLKLLDSNKESIFTNEEWKMILAFKNFWDDFEPITLECEKTVFSKRFKFAGTIDWMGTIKMPGKDKKAKRVLAIMDWKTSKAIYNSNLVQVAAYAFASTEMEKKKAQALAVIQLGSKNKKGYAVKFVEDRETCFNVFLAVKTIWDFENPNARPSTEDLPGEIKI